MPRSAIWRKLVAMTRPPELPEGGSWADPTGPGRCGRCGLWLTDDSTCTLSLRQRPKVRIVATIVLCCPCAAAVAKAFRAHWYDPVDESLFDEP